MNCKFNDFDFLEKTMAKFFSSIFLESNLLVIGCDDVAKFFWPVAKLVASFFSSYSLESKSLVMIYDDVAKKNWPNEIKRFLQVVWSPRK